MAQVAIGVKENQSKNAYPLTVKDLRKHFDCSERTARTWIKDLPKHMIRRANNRRGDIRLKPEAIPWMEEFNRARRGF